MDSTIDKRDGREPADTAVGPIGVLVFIEDTPKGRRIGYEMCGGLDPLAAPAILELACKTARVHLGLE
jgi:hypothetical protein